MNGSQHLLNGFGIGFGHWRSFKCLRAGRESELMREYDLATVCKRIGNSPAVAAKHYATSIALNSDFRRATGLDTLATGPEAQQSADGEACQRRTWTPPGNERTPRKQGSVDACH